MSADLNYRIGADASNFNTNVRGLAETATTASNEVSQSLAQASRSVDNLGGSAISASMRFQQMRSGLSAARDGALAFAVGGQRADMMLMAMGHHISSLVNETGSLQGAFKALGQSLIGPGGAILALTVIYEIYEHLEKQSKKTAEAQTEFQKALNDNAKSASDELAHLTILYQASQNDALSRQDRLTAVRELQKEYPAYFGNLSQEAILAGKAAGAYDRLTTSIINSAVVKAGQEGLAEQIKPLIQLTATLQAEQIKAEEAYQRAKAAFKPDTSTTGSQAGFRAVNPNAVLGHNVASNTGFINVDGDVKRLDEYKKTIQDKIKAHAAAIQELLQQYGVSSLLKHEEIRPDHIKKVKDGFALLEQEILKAKQKLQDAILSGHVSPTDFTNPLVLNVERLIIKLNAAKKAYDDLLRGATNTPFMSGAKPSDINISDYKFHKDAVQGAKDGKAGIDESAYNKEIIGQQLAANATQLSNLDALYAQEGIKTKEYLNEKYFLEESALNLQQSLYETDTADYAKYTERKAQLTLKYHQQLMHGTQQERLALKELVNIVGKGLEGAFEKALSGTENLVTAMGAFLEQLIEKLIAAALAALALSVLLNATGLGAFLGIASSSSSFSGIFGTLSGLSGTMGSQSSGFASHAAGGIFTTPHIGQFAEAGPEAIVTPKHLQDFAGTSGSQNIVIQPAMIGADMYWKQKVRGDKYIGRTK